ncbi:MAG: argininosuccinate synthase [Eubacteriaceae bacterium]|nr:argininosuccinate synthase [Eubacteriaceae bacterium]
MEKLNIVLAYSGGLDTSTIIPWLKENYTGSAIHAVCIDIGQIEEGDDYEQRAIQYGADSVCTIDATQEFVEDYLFPMVKSGAIYEGKYLLGTSIARPLIAKKLIDKAIEIGADTICHGATGKGNDQVRFDLTIMALAPQIKILAPWRLWDIKSRQDAIDYLAQRGIFLNVAADSTYSRDENLWHLSHEGLELEDPGNGPNYPHLLQRTCQVEESPDVGEEVEIEFVKGIPVSLNGVKLGGLELIRELNEIGGKHGIGIVDLTENRVVGLKSRGVYETPGGAILYHAHNELEELCLDKDMNKLKRHLALEYADLVYSGKYFYPLREALDAFFNVTQETVTGKCKLLLYKGNIIGRGKTSPYSLYNEEISSFTTGELYDHHDAEGFTKLFGLSLKTRALMEQSLGKE